MERWTNERTNIRMYEQTNGWTEKPKLYTPTYFVCRGYKYVLGYQTYDPHKTSASEEITGQLIKRVVSLTQDMPTGPPLHPYQINYLKQYGSYGLHKILASGEITI